MLVAENPIQEGSFTSTQITSENSYRYSIRDFRSCHKKINPESKMI
jgi:hypothetical protein